MGKKRLSHIERIGQALGHLKGDRVAVDLGGTPQSAFARAAPSGWLEYQEIDEETEEGGPVRGTAPMDGGASAQNLTATWKTALAWRY